MLVAVIGAATGGSAVYNDFSDSEFKKPITLREAKVKSFKSQIASAKERGDEKAVLRVSLDYENYEESWRTRQTLSSITQQINNLVSLEISPEQSNQIEMILSNKGLYFTEDAIDPTVFGNAYLATGDFEKASQYYQVAANLEPSNANLYALRALALQGQAQTVSVKKVEVELIERAAEFAQTAKDKGVDSKKFEFLANELRANK